MKIPQLLSNGLPSFSFEYFPPKTPAGEKNLFETVLRLKGLRPTFVSVTYGAGGSTREKTIEIVQRIQSEARLTAMAHLTCVGHSQQEITEILARLESAKIENVLALRGDPPQGQSRFVPHPEGFQYAAELVGFIRKHFCFSVGAACYPETHPEAASPEADLTNLKAKVDAGAEFLITQLFFDNNQYWRFVGRARSMEIDVPIIPGIMPILDVAQIQRFTSMCGATIPQPLAQKLEALRRDPEAVPAFGVEYATQQCRELLHGGAPGLHFYTLNKSDATRRILQTLHAEGFGTDKPASPALGTVIGVD